MALVSFTILGILIADGHLPGENHHDGGPHHSAIPKDQITIAVSYTHLRAHET